MKHPKTVLACLVALSIFGSVLLQRRGPPPIRVDSSPTIAAILTDSETPSLNPQRADVTIVLFTDYQCVVCKASNPALQNVLAHDRNVRVLYKDWPILGEASVAAARAALASDRQGKYPRFHDALMRTSGRLDADAILAAAARADVNIEQLRADLDGHRKEIDEALSRNALQAWTLGLTGTPGYLVGPFLERGRLTETRLRKLIADSRAEAKRS